MKMSIVEKQFVNSPSHSQQVSSYAESLLCQIEFKAGQKFLDVGCAFAAAPIHLAQKYHLNVTGIDVDPEQIRLAQKQSAALTNACFLTLDGTQLPFENNEFDIVFTNKVTHHITNWQAALAEMIRVVKPGGYFIYSDLVAPDWLAAIGSRVAGQHLGFPTATGLNRFAKVHNLAQIHLKKTPTIYEAIFQKVSGTKA